MKRAAIYLTCALCFAPSIVNAQHWSKVLALSNTMGSSAFFFNAREGVIGTGHYLSISPAEIYYTTDSGSTWRLSQLPNPYLRGEVTDIFFRDRKNGWATIREFTETGWSGIYRSTDGGQTWSRIHQAGFPVSIRETERGVFYTDRDIDPGVMFSADTGKTWTHIASTDQALGIDFMDDAHGFVTSQASNASCPHLYTSDSGKTWQTIASTSEAWTPYGDPISRNFFLASERDQLTLSSETAIIKVPISSWSETRVKVYGDSGLSGGIAGSHICQSIMYVQGREPATIGPNAMLRSTDAGVNWQTVGGPNTLNDKRFGVTGRGAVVFAFDDSGGVWRTMDGGDGTLSPSVLRFVTLSLPDTISSPVCDSAIVPILLGYRVCDSVQISNVEFLNDSAGELSVPLYYNPFAFIQSTSDDTLKIRYRPTRQIPWTAIMRLTVRQPDGYTEDTTIRIPLRGTSSKQSLLSFTETTKHDTIDFDSVSICSDAFHTLRITDVGCGPITIDSIVSSDNAFSLASQFRPFVLSPETSRSFLLHFIPDSIGPDRAFLWVYHSAGIDSILLMGTGYSTGRAVSISFPDSIVAPLCDSEAFPFTLKNVACESFTLDSEIVSGPFHTTGLPSFDTIYPRNVGTVNFVLVPRKTGLDTGRVHFIFSYSSSGRYDTTISLVGMGTAGTSSIGLSRDSLFLGTTSVCSAIADTLVLYSRGCSDLFDTISIDSNKFSLENRPAPSIPPGDSDLVILQYVPDTALGIIRSSLKLMTSAGMFIVPVSIRVVDNGTTILSLSPNIEAYPCEMQPFSVSIQNHFCDSIKILHASVTGEDSTDFSFGDTVFAIGAGQNIALTGSFMPLDTGAYKSSIRFDFQESNGNRHDTVISVVGEGLSVAPIKIAFGALQLHAPVSTPVTIPVFAKNSSAVTARRLTFLLRLNTDVLTPESLGAVGMFSNAQATFIPISRNSVALELTLPNDTAIDSGILCEIVCRPFVSTSLSTPIELTNIHLYDANGSEACLPVTLEDSIAKFTLDPACGDSTLATFLALGTIRLDRISPNPTTGLVHLTFAVPIEYSNDAVLEVWDELGERVATFPLHFEGCGVQTMELDLAHGTQRNSEGVRYLRIRTPSGSFDPGLTQRVVLWK